MSMRINKHFNKLNSENIQNNEPKRGHRLSNYMAAVVFTVGGVIGVAGHNELSQARELNGVTNLDTQNIASQAKTINAQNQRIGELTGITKDQSIVLKQDTNTINAQNQSMGELSQEVNQSTNDNEILTGITKDQSIALNRLEAAQSGLEQSTNQAEAKRLTDELRFQGSTKAYMLNGTVNIHYNDGSVHSFRDPFVLSTSNGQKNFFVRYS